MKRLVYLLMLPLAFVLCPNLSWAQADPYLDFSGSYADVLTKVKGVDGMRIVFEQTDAVISAQKGSVILKYMFAGGKLSEVSSVHSNIDGKPSADKAFADYKGLLTSKGATLSEDTPSKVVASVGGSTYTLEVYSPEQNTVFEVRMKLKYAN